MAADIRIKPEVLSGIDLASLDALKTLKHDADQLRARRASLDAMKADFAEPVYRRVDADYAKQLDALERKAEPLRQQALAAYAGLRNAVKDSKTSTAPLEMIVANGDPSLEA